ncbi:hypothetical protein GCM10010176_000210 [Nonomuraea spiralis]|nr:hypothetical protein GCM10010176_000210 [Nonomuraea spiralis]
MARAAVVLLAAAGAALVAAGPVTAAQEDAARAEIRMEPRGQVIRLAVDVCAATARGCGGR